MMMFWIEVKDTYRISHGFGEAGGVWIDWVLSPFPGKRLLLPLVGDGIILNHSPPLGLVRELADEPHHVELAVVQIRGLPAVVAWPRVIRCHGQHWKVPIGHVVERETETGLVDDWVLGGCQLMIPGGGEMLYLGQGFPCFIFDGIGHPES